MSPQAKASLKRGNLFQIAATLGLACAVFAPSTAQSQSPCGPSTPVQAGDTYFSISQRCDIPVEAIQQANPRVDQNSLQVGQTLRLASSAAEAEPMPETYRVQSGDTLQTVAAALGTTIDAIISANPELDPYALQVGQIIRPPGSGSPGFPGQPQPDTQVSGVLTNEGVECQALRGHDGRLYTLIGDLEGHNTGDVVQVSGSEPDVSVCQQGTTIDVEDIRGLG